MTTGDGAVSRRHPLLDWKGLVGLLISGALLWYAFRDVHFGEIAAEIRAADPLLLALSGLVMTLPFALRAIRWRHLLRPIHPGSRFPARFAATCIGFMANNLLPARIGEFARAFALTRLEPVRMSGSFGTLVVERIFDGLTVVVLLLVALAWPGFPRAAGYDFGLIAAVAAAIMVAGVLVLLLIVARPVASISMFERTVARVLPRSIRRVIVDTLEAFLRGMAAIRDWRLVIRAGFWSLTVWLTAAVGTWIGFRAFDIDAPLIAGVFLQSIIALAVSLPSAPGFFGVFEAAARVGLVEVWGVESARAVSFALGFHLAGFVPVTVIGLFYVWRLGISWRDVEQSEEAVESEVEAEPRAAERAAGPGSREGGARA